MINVQIKKRYGAATVKATVTAASLEDVVDRYGTGSMVAQPIPEPVEDAPNSAANTDREIADLFYVSGLHLTDLQGLETATR